MEGFTELMSEISLKGSWGLSKVDGTKFGKKKKVKEDPVHW